MPNTPLHPRTIKSFAVRAGRISLRQQQALQSSFNYLLPNDISINGQTIFGRDAPLILEIGFGMGHALIQNALTAPDNNYIGIEVFRRGIGALLAELATQNITNVRIFQGDAVEILTKVIPDECLDGVQIFFPDPWPKRRHHKRRLIQLPFIQLLLKKLKTGGYLHLATDWEDYAMQMLQVLSSVEELTNTAGAGNFSIERMGRPLTKYEQRGQRLGHGVWDLVFTK